MSTCTALYRLPDSTSRSTHQAMQILHIMNCCAPVKHCLCQHFQVHLGHQHTSNTCLLTFAEEVRPVYTVPAGTGTNTHAGM